MCYIPPKKFWKIPKIAVRYMYLVEESHPSYQYQPVQEEFQDKDIQEEAIRLMSPVYQILKVVRNFYQAFHLDQVVDRQTMKAMEVAQEEIQEEMMVKSPKILIKTFMVNSIEDHPMIQTRVGTMVDEDVEEDAGLLARSISGRSRYPSWIFLPEYIFRRRAR